MCAAPGEPPPKGRLPKRGVPGVILPELVRDGDCVVALGGGGLGGRGGRLTTVALLVTDGSIGDPPSTLSALSPSVIEDPMAAATRASSSSHESTSF